MANIRIMPGNYNNSVVSYVTCAGRTIAPHGVAISRVIKASNVIGVLNRTTSDPITGNFSMLVPALPWTEFTVEAVGDTGENSVTYAHCREF